MKTIKQGVRIFVSKQELQKSSSKSDVEEFGDTEQTAYAILNFKDGQAVSISPRCFVPISACKPL